MTRHILMAIAAALLLPLGAAAQQKVATVNIQEIFHAMPEAAAADTTMKVASQQYQAEFKRLEGEFDQKYAYYQSIQADSETPATIKERRMQEIQQNDDSMRQFAKQARTDLDNRRRALEAPIYRKITAAVAAVSSEQGLTYVLDVSTTPVVYRGADAIDITTAVKQRLGIAK